jgi:dipeptidyl aminopeptidase/acylaminoacyl peptidase
VDLTPDGRTAVSTWGLAEPRGSRRTALVAVDTASGERRVLADDGTSDFGDPPVSPDGSLVAAVCERRSTPQEPVDERLVVLPLDGSAARGTSPPGWDRWSGEHRWTPDGTALVVAADEQGGRPVFRIDLGDGGGHAPDGDRGHYRRPARLAGRAARLALRDAVDAAPAPVRLDAHAADQEPFPLQGPRTAEQPPHGLTEVTATAADGTPLRSWLVLPQATGRTRCCSGCTGVRSAPGTAGPGAGTRTSWRPAATRCCCPTRRCRPATGWTWSAAAGAPGETSRTPT